jgi:hypothetical protein
MPSEIIVQQAQRVYSNLFDDAECVDELPPPNSRENILQNLPTGSDIRINLFFWGGGN